MKNKLFTPDASKLLFEIKIEVMENCTALKVVNHELKEVNYHHLIGVLESQKLHLIMLQREHNMKLLKKKTKKP
mgnify:CR=1 FL=1